MIQKINIQNFQAHAKSELEFSPFTNIIVGNSDSGKSSILRAIRWVLFNKPSGESFRSWWGGSTKVSLFTNDHKVTRLRGKNNCYFLDGAKFEATRSDVPEEISKILNINDINVQRQHDKHFLFSDSPGEVAKHFNAIAHIDDINYATKNIQSWIRKTKQEIENSESQITNYTEELKLFSNLESLEYQVSQLEKLDQDKQAIETKQSILSKLVNDLSEIENDINSLQEVLKLQSTVNACLGNFDRLKTITEEKNALLETIKELGLVVTEQKTLNSVIKYGDSVEQVLELYRNKAKVTSEYEELSEQIILLTNTEKEIINQKKLVKELQEKFNKEMPETCPLCGTKL